MSRTVAQLAATVDAKGIYTIPVAARLLTERPSTIRRWAFGYRRRHTDYAAAIRTDVPEVDGCQVLTFLELVELMFVQGMLRSGLSWPKVREASRTAARLLANESHPFATKRWFVDAAALYLQLGEANDDRLLVEVAGHGQVAIESVLRPYLKQLQFDERGLAQQWFPMGLERPVVVDPRRAYGMPITARGGVPTDAIAGLHAAGDEVNTIAAWFRIDDAEVEAAIEFETAIAAAA